MEEVAAAGEGEAVVIREGREEVAGGGEHEVVGAAAAVREGEAKEGEVVAAGEGEAEVTRERREEVAGGGEHEVVGAAAATREGEAEEEEVPAAGEGEADLPPSPKVTMQQKLCFFWEVEQEKKLRSSQRKREKAGMTKEKKRS